MRKVSPSNGGFSLLELSFASGILALALAMMFGSLLSLSVVGEVSEGRTRATAQLAGVMEDLRTLSQTALLEYLPPDETVLDSGQSVDVECYLEDGTALSLPVSTGMTNPPVLPNPVEVKATLTWQGRQGREYQLSATTLCGR